MGEGVEGRVKEGLDEVQLTLQQQLNSQSKTPLIKYW